MLTFLLCVLTLLSFVAVLGCAVRLVYLLYGYEDQTLDQPKVVFWWRSVKLAALILLFIRLMLFVAELAVL